MHVISPMCLNINQKNNTFQSLSLAYDFFKFCTTLSLSHNIHISLLAIWGSHVHSAKLQFFTFDVFPHIFQHYQKKSKKWHPKIKNLQLQLIKNKYQKREIKERKTKRKKCQNKIKIKT